MNKEDWKDRQQNIAMVKAGGYTHAITFNTYKKMPPAKLTRLVKFVISILERDFLKTKLDWTHWYERASGNAHSHSAVKIDDPHTWKKLKKHAPHIWAKHAGKDAQLWFDTYEDSVATYITKDGLMLAI